MPASLAQTVKLQTIAAAGPAGLHLQPFAVLARKAIRQSLEFTRARVMLDQAPTPEC
jgi:hypothetical protein